MNPPFRHQYAKTSVWNTTAQMPEFPPLADDIAADVCIIGGGVAGLSTAYALCQDGKSVVVIDAGELAHGETLMTTAHLTCVSDERFARLEDLHGADGARLAIQSHQAAVSRIEKIVADERIDCDFERVDGFLFLAPDSAKDLLDAEYLAAQRAGLAVERMDAPPLPFDIGPCLRFPDQAQFHPLRYLSALALAVAREGGRIYPYTRADSIDAGPPGIVRSLCGNITADNIIVATNSPINDLLAMHTKQSAFMSYVVGARVPRGSVHKGLYWDTAEPYHYVRTQALENTFGESELLIIGGEDHRFGQEEDTLLRYARLQQWAREHFPQIEAFEFEWSGEIMQSVDGLGYIGHNPMDHENVYIVTGDSGMGITHGTIASMLLTDLVSGRDNPWATLYAPSRKTLRAAGTFATGAVNAVTQYADWLTGGDVSSPDEIQPGGGAILRRGLKKIAAYRDDVGMLHELSAVCPHLGGLVRWNDTEKTWDCPCHGSRFDCLGEAIHGPANKPLAAMTPSKEVPAGSR